MGGSIPKQFLEVGGMPIIVRVIKRFAENKNIDSVIVAMNGDWMEYCIKLLKDNGIDTDKNDLIEGGSTCFESLYNIAKKAAEIR